MNNDIKYFLVGSTTVCLCKFITYPLDRIRLINQTTMQKHNFSDIFRKEGFRGYFKNFHMIGIVNFPKAGLTFTCLNYSKNTMNYSPFLSGIIAGTVSGTFFFPFDIYNINKTYKIYNSNDETQKMNKLNKLNMKIIPKLYMTHIIGLQVYYGINFGMFHLVKKHTEKYGSVGTFIAGLTAECITILFTYPIDTIRKRIIANYNNKLIYTSLFSGFKYILIKSPVSCGTFYMLSEFLLSKVM